MKRLLITTSITALLLASTAAWAGGDHDRDKHDRGDRYGYDDGRYDDGRYYDGRRYDDRYDRDRYDHDGRDRHGKHDGKHGRKRHHDNGRHLGQIKHGYRRGERAPMVYLQPRYYVQDYRAYNLAPPPRGYRWVRPEHDRYLLVEAASGLISQVLGY